MIDRHFLDELLVRPPDLHPPLSRTPLLKSETLPTLISFCRLAAQMTLSLDTGLSC